MPNKRSINEINRETASTYKSFQNQNVETPFSAPTGPQFYEDYAPDAEHYHAAAKKKGRGKKIALVVCLSFLVVLVSAGTAFALYMSHITEELNKGDKSEAELMSIDDALDNKGYNTSLTEPFYMLLIGSDERYEGEPARSDTNIIVRVDPQEDVVSMVSIPRDTKIEIPGHGVQKFNAAYAFDRVPGVIKATEELLGIKVAHYAEVNFLKLKGLVDAVGGVTVDVETKIDDWKCDNGDGNHYVIEAGTQKLMGGPALTFARSRQYADGDFTRTSNQRKLIQAIVDEVLSAPITVIPAIIEAGASCVTTDLSIIDIIGLAQQFADNGDIIMYNAMLPSYTQMINGISFVINDEEKTAEMLELFVAGKDPSGIVSNKSAPAINNNSVDTSKVLMLGDDDEVAQGTQPVNDETANPPESSSSAASSSSSSSASSSTKDPNKGSSDKNTSHSSSSSASSSASNTSKPSANTSTGGGSTTDKKPSSSSAATKSK